MDAIHITKEHTGKMMGMQSMSTSCAGNRHCEENAKVEGSVCQKCYAQRIMKMRPNVDKCMRRNAEILANVDLEEHKELIPNINAAFFRIEAFGDLLNEQHVRNYFTIANANEDTHFALWTKNPALISRVIESGYDKPDNLQIIVSSLFLNKVAEYQYEFIDKIFTVYDKEHAENVTINCGKKKCIDCKLCYKNNGVKYINEILK